MLSKINKSNFKRLINSCQFTDVHATYHNWIKKLNTFVSLIFVVGIIMPYRYGLFLCICIIYCAVLTFRHFLLNVTNLEHLVSFKTNYGTPVCIQSVNNHLILSNLCNDNYQLKNNFYMGLKFQWNSFRLIRRKHF